MHVPRLFVDARLRPHDAVTLSGEQTHRLTRVLRLRADAIVHAFNGSGDQYACALRRDGRDWCLVPMDPVAQLSPSPLRITLAQSVSRSERMDFALQKAVELGVASIAPVIAERSTFKPGAARVRNRRSHWQRIIEQACEQCGRADLPGLSDPRPVQEWVADNRSAILLSATAGQALGDVALTGPGVAVLVGPEGGFSDAELDAARAAGLSEAHIGPRTLRTETAALAAIAVLQLRGGDLR